MPGRRAQPGAAVKGEGGERRPRSEAKSGGGYDPFGALLDAQNAYYNEADNRDRN